MKNQEIRKSVPGAGIVGTPHVRILGSSGPQCAPVPPPRDTIIEHLGQLEKMLEYENEQLTQLRAKTADVMRPELENGAQCAGSPPAQGSRVSAILEDIMGQVNRNTLMIQDMIRLADL